MRKAVDYAVLVTIK